jgi:hypothetical protein
MLAGTTPLKSTFTPPVTACLPAIFAAPCSPNYDDEATARLALALLHLAQRVELEVGLVLHVAPALQINELAAHARISTPAAAQALETFGRAGLITYHRQRYILHDAATLQRIALGAPV